MTPSKKQKMSNDLSLGLIPETSDDLTVAHSIPCSEISTVIANESLDNVVERSSNSLSIVVS